MVAVISVASLAGLAFLSLIVFLGSLAYVVAPSIQVPVIPQPKGSMYLYSRYLGLKGVPI